MIFIRYIQGGRKQLLIGPVIATIRSRFAENLHLIMSFLSNPFPTTFCVLLPSEIVNSNPRVASKRREPLARNPTVSAMLSIEILVNSFPFACLQFKENRANDIMTIHLLIHLSLSVTGYLSIRSARISPIPEYNSAEEIRHTNGSKESYRL